MSRPLRPAGFFGRDAEVAALCGLIRDVADGAGTRAVLVAGPPGIGKTRLVDEAVRSAGAPFVRIEVTHSPHVAGPYLGLHLAFDRAATRATGAIAVDLAELTGALALGEGIDAVRRCASVVRLLRRLAARSPLALVLDEVQWADRASVELAQFVARELDDAPVFLALIARDERADEVASLFASAMHVRLGPLADDAIARLLRDAVRDEAQPPIDDFPAIIDRAGGNPHFALELLRHRAAGDAVFPAFPATYARPVQDRFFRLPDAVRASVEIAVVLEAVDVAVLAALGATSADEVERHLHEAARASLVQRRGDAWSFDHPLTQAALLDAIVASRRRELHASIAAYLGEHGGPAAQLAHHRWHAGDASGAATASAAAGEAACAAYAYRDAIPHLERALGAQELAQRERGRLRAMLALARISTGQFEPAERELADARIDCEACGDRDGQITVELHTTRLMYMSSRFAESDQAATRALALVGPDTPSDLRFRALMHRAQNAAYNGEPDVLRSLLDRAQPDEPRAAPVDRAIYHQSRSREALFAGDAARFAASARAAIAAAEASGRIEPLTSILNNIGCVAPWLGLGAFARETLERATGLAYTYGLRVGVATTRINAARFALLEGRRDEALAALHEALRADGARSGMVRLLIAGYGTSVALVAGDAELAATCRVQATTADAIASGSDPMIAALAVADAIAALGRDDRATAATVLRDAVAACRERQLPLLLPSWSGLVGTDDDLRIATSRALDPAPAGEAERALLAAERARRSGRRRLTARHADDAAARFARLGWPGWRELAEAVGGRAVRDDVCFAPPPPVSREPAAIALTKREREVALRAAAGLSNRAIAAELGLSARTVENYLQSVFTRLNIRSRSELAVDGRLGRSPNATDSA